jgi:hypothetical protein
VTVGVFPGSFDPLTTAHLAVADAAIAVLGLARLDLVLSTVALAKEHGGHTALDERLAAIEAAGAHRPIRGLVTDHQLIVDIADGYDVCIVGADKWHQLHDAAFYDGSPASRDAAVSRLPRLAVAPRAGIDTPPPSTSVILLEIDSVYSHVSSTGARAGRHEWRA